MPLRGKGYSTMSSRAGPVLVLTLSLFVREICTMAPAEREQMRQTVEEMFYHAFDGYMERAFPHDELRPISGGYTDALVELGAPAQPTRRGYSGVALTLIDSLDTLAVIGNASEFARGVRWVSENVDFDIDIDVSVFETTIRLLGGLLSAHMLANGTMVDGASHVRVAGYGGELLVLARDLGERLLGAFDGCEAPLPPPPPPPLLSPAASPPRCRLPPSLPPCSPLSPPLAPPPSRP